MSPLIKNAKDNQNEPNAALISLLFSPLILWHFTSLPGLCFMSLLDTQSSESTIILTAARLSM